MVLNPFLLLRLSHYLGLFVVIALVVAFHKRTAIRERYIAFQESRQLHFLPLNSDDFSVEEESSSDHWLRDIGRGLTSKTFNLISDNLLKGDSRKGLDENARNEIMNIMDLEGISFDDARLKYFQNKMQSNDIGEDGIPRDPKFVSFH